MTAALLDALEGRSEMPRVVSEGSRRLIEYGPGNGHELYPEMVDVGLQLERMSTDGVELSLLSSNVPGVDWFEPREGVAVARAVNDELAGLVAEHSGRLAGLALLPMRDPEAAARELSRAVDAGLSGGTVFSNVAGSPLDEERFRVVFEHAAALGAPIMIHPTFPLSAKAMDAYALIPTVGFLTDTTVAVLRLILGGAFERDADLRLYLPHAGSLLPQLAGRIDNEAGRLPGGMGDLTVAPSEQLRLLYTDVVCDWPPALRSCLELLGPDRVMFGSDFPFWQARSSIETLAASGLDTAALAAISYRNALDLFRLPLAVDPDLDPDSAG